MTGAFSVAGCLGVIVALPAEAAAILADERFAWSAAGPGEYASSAFPVRLAISGVGKVFAAWACARLAGPFRAGGEDKPGCDLMLSLGTSGGLSSEAVGSLRLVKEFVEHDMLVGGLGFEPYVTPFSGMEGPVIRSLSPEAEALALGALAESGMVAPWARAASGDRFIGDAAEARSLRESTGASVCDMESAAIAKLCALRGARAGTAAGAPRAASAAGTAGLDFFALRSISDNADHSARLSWQRQVELSAVDFDSYLYAIARLLKITYP